MNLPLPIRYALGGAVILGWCAVMAFELARLSREEREKLVDDLIEAATV